MVQGVETCRGGGGGAGCEGSRGGERNLDLALLALGFISSLHCVYEL